MRFGFAVIIAVAVAGCVDPAPSTGMTSQSSTTCVSDPIAFDGDHAGGLVPQCRHWYTYDQASADILYRSSIGVGYTLYLPWYTLSCWEFTDDWGTGIGCNLQVPTAGFNMWCDYYDDGSVICTQTSSR